VCAISTGRADEDRQHLLKQLERRDWQLWALTLGILVALGLFVGLVSLWMWEGSGDAVWSQWVRTILVLGFVGLTLLFCGHVGLQEASVKRLRRELLAEQGRYRALHDEVSELEKVVAHTVSDRARERLKSEFIAAVSHRLRTPLTHIRNSLDRVGQGKAGPLNEEQDRLLAVAARDVDGLTQMIDQILDLSRIESGRVRFDFQTADLGALALAAAQAHRSAARDRGVRLSVDSVDAASAARADAERITQVVGHLVETAIGEASLGGEVRLGVRAVTDETRGEIVGATTFHPSAKEDYVEVFVEGGRGRSEEELRALFDSFLSGVPDPEGAPDRGLALAVARDIVKAHEGVLWAQAGPSGTTLFRFVLPVRGTSVERLESVRLVGDAIERARSRNEPFSLVVLRLVDARAAADPEGSGSQVPLAETAALAQRAIRGSDTLAVHPALAEVHLFLARTGEQGGRIVSGRFRELLAEHRKRRPDPLRGVQVGVGFASFPDDAMTAVEIEELARSAADVPVPATAGAGCG
jgi:signal transduction histidine kinase